MNNGHHPDEHQKRLLFIREITRQLCHPETGLPKDLSPPPVTLGDWYKCLKAVYGWVNVGIESNVAGMFHELQIGEVIPATSPNMDIYNYGFATSEIGRLLGTKSDNKMFRAIINYYSFSRIVEILMNSQSKEYRVKFNDSLKSIFTDVKPDTFWLNILISPDKAEYLRLNEIGEVIVKEGTCENARLESKQRMAKPAVWNMDEDDEYDENEEKQDSSQDTSQDILSELKEFSEMKVTETKNNNRENIEEDNSEPTPFRLVMNNTTLLNLLTYACNFVGSATSDVNVFEYMGGEDSEFTDLFGKLQI